MSDNISVVVNPVANEEETAAIISAISLYFTTLSSTVDKAEDKSDSWVTKHRLLARKGDIRIP